MDTERMRRVTRNPYALQGVGKASAQAARQQARREAATARRDAARMHAESLEEV